MFCWLAKTLDQFEIPELPWYTVEEGSQELREIGRLECIYHVRHAHMHIPGGLREHTIHHDTEKLICERSPRILKDLWGYSSLWIRNSVGTFATELGNLNVMEIHGS